MATNLSPQNSRLVASHQARVQIGPSTVTPAVPPGMALPDAPSVRASDADYHRNLAAARNALTRVDPLTVDAGPAGEWGWRQYVRDADEHVVRQYQADQRKLVEWPSLGREVFTRLYDDQGMVDRPLENVSPLALDLVAAIQNLPSWRLLRGAASTHYGVAGEAVEELLGGLKVDIGLHKLPDDVGSPERLRVELEALQAYRDRLIASDDPADRAQALDGALDDAINHLQRRVNRGQSRRQALDEAIAKAHDTGALERLVAGIAQRAAEHAQAVQVAQRTFGSGTGSSMSGLTGVPSKALVDLLRRNADLRHLIEIMGRMRATVRARAPDAEGRGSLLPDDVVTGDRLDRLLGGEVGQLVSPDPVIQQAALLRLVEKQSMLRARKGREPKEGGDLVVLLDRSGSMSAGATSKDGMSRWDWARAVGMSAVLEAQASAKEGGRRRVFLATFTDAGQERMTLIAPDESAQAMSGGTVLPEGLAKAFQMLAEGTSGGTETAAAIRKVAATIAGKGLKEPDWLIVTDGEWPDLSKREIDAIKGPGSRLYVVLLEGTAKIKGADRVWTIPSLSMDSAANIIQEVTLL